MGRLSEKLKERGPLSREERLKLNRGPIRKTAKAKFYVNPVKSSSIYGKDTKPGAREKARYLRKPVEQLARL